MPARRPDLMRPPPAAPAPAFVSKHAIPDCSHTGARGAGWGCASAAATCSAACRSSTRMFQDVCGVERYQEVT
eukprot:scaffold90524_cov23-Tisochrysis_lutea.AAC.2